jgi:hypothetical protein
MSANKEEIDRRNKVRAWLETRGNTCLAGIASALFTTVHDTKGGITMLAHGYLDAAGNQSWFELNVLDHDLVVLELLSRTSSEDPD